MILYSMFVVNLKNEEFFDVKKKKKDMNMQFAAFLLVKGRVAYLKTIIFKLMFEK